MALTNNFNFNPYYDDYDENKKFLRILFKPGYAVQARELTQLQTQIQKQIERFGNSIYVNGSAVLGCSYTKQICAFLKLKTTYGGVSINVSNFDDKIIINTANTKRAKIVVAIPEDLALGEPPTFLIQQVFGEPFTPGEAVRTLGSNPFFAEILGETTAIGEGQAFSISEGVIYYNGFFIKVDQQSVAISKYDTTSASLKVGLEINEYFTKASDDSSLIDPAQEATNYQAPGADRYKVELTLATRSLDATDDLVNFIQLAQFVSGKYQNTKKTTIYSKLGDEMAKRTFEESGNYVLEPFKVRAKANTTNSSKFDVVVSPGTAYVNGYRVDIKYPETISINKARTTANVSDRIIRANYGNFFYTTNHFRTFDINSLPTVDLHCVPAALIDTTSTQTIQNTKIGTAQIKSCEFVSSPDSSATACTNQFVFATEVFNVNIGTLNGNIVSATSDGSKVVLPSTFSPVNDAYTGAFLRIVSGPGAVEADKIIVDYDGSTDTATVSPPFSVIPTTASVFEINFNTQDVESLAKFTTTSRDASADISTRLGIEPTTFGTTNNAILFDSLNEELIFNVGQTNVFQGTLKLGSYLYQARFSAQLTDGVSPTISSTSSDTFAALSGSPTTDEIRNNYTVYCVNPGTSTYTTGQIIPTNAITITNHGTTSVTVAVTGGGSMQIDLVATLQTAGQRTKTFIQANTANVDTGATEVQIDGTRIKLISSMGQVHYANTAGTRIAERNLSLYVADVVRLAKVVEIPSGVINQTNFSAGTDVTSRYRLIDNQTDSEYRHSYIRLKAGETAPIGALVICFDRYQHSSPTGGAFTVESYPTSRYDNIGVYFSKNGSQGYDLRDCLDFRPSRSDGASGSIEGDYGFIGAAGAKIPKRQAELRVSFDHYLPRIDRLHLAQNGLYDISSGSPSLDKRAPTEKDNSVSICDINIPAYTEDIKDITFKHYENRRYTMADIGKIESRLKAVEYYTALSLLENDALSKSDSSMYGRSKNGIITDSFVGFNVADLINGEFNAGINRQTKELTTKTRQTESYFRLVPPENGTTSLVNARRDGALVYMNANDSIVFVDQPLATTAMSVNPFNVQFFVGALKLSPKSDVWIDTVTLPDLIIQDEGNENMINFINESQEWAEWEWGSWDRVGNLVEVSGTSRSVTVTDGRTRGRRWTRTDTITPVSTFENQRRNGTLTYYVPETVLTSLGESVIDTSVIPFMRAIDLSFTLQGMRPFEVAYPFFDDDSISNNVSIKNAFTLSTGPLGYYANGAMPERVMIKNGGTVIGNADAVLISNTQLYVANINLPNPVTSWSTAIFVQGNTSGYNAQVISYNLNSCFVNTSIFTPNTTHFALSTDAFGAALSYTLNETPVRIVSGTGAGQQSVVASYDSTTRRMGVSPAWTVIPGANSIVQIGNMKMDRHGCIAGTFHIPGGLFTTGLKNFKLSNQVDGSVQYPFSRAIETFYAQGTLQTKQERILSSISPRQVVDTAIQDRRVQVGQREDRVEGATVWIDPVAETFLVDGVAHPDGVFLSKVRLCFQTRDDQLPVRIQIRPSVNGYPSALQSVPFSDVVLTPDQVKVSDRPNFEDPSKYTEFVFESPVHLLPGEHALVVLSNSNNYFIWTAIKDEKDVNTGNAVGQQPYAGSFFKSQNSSTWTADQDTDLMFRLYKYEWDTSIESEAIFTLDWANPARTLTSNANVDVMVLKTQDINFANTFLQHTFTSKNKRGQSTGFVQVIPNMTTMMLDTFGSRVIEPTSLNNFKVKATMRTRNPDVSPILDIDRYFILPIENIINNLGISNNNVFMSNVGNYTSATVAPTVTFSAPPAGGVTATGTANLVSATVGGVANRRIVDKIIITNSGSGYTSTPTVTLTGGTTTSGYAATAYVTGETDRRNGNSLCRYVTKKITLADGFNSGDLRVYLTAHKPAGSNILVYYKILAAGDAQQWTDRTWQLMTQIEQPAYVSASFEDFTELVFAPGTNNRSSDTVEYTSATSGKFYDFNSFAIKVVMSGTNTVDVPRIKDFRAIAMPAI